MGTERRPAARRGRRGRRRGSAGGVVAAAAVAVSGQAATLAPRRRAATLSGAAASGTRAPAASSAAASCLLLAHTGCERVGASGGGPCRGVSSRAAVPSRPRSAQRAASAAAAPYRPAASRCTPCGLPRPGLPRLRPRRATCVEYSTQQCSTRPATRGAQVVVWLQPKQAQCDSTAVVADCDIDCKSSV